LEAIYYSGVVDSALVFTAVYRNIYRYYYFKRLSINIMNLPITSTKRASIPSTPIVRSHRRQAVLSPFTPLAPTPVSSLPTTQVTELTEDAAAYLLRRLEALALDFCARTRLITVPEQDCLVNLVMNVV
jgi:hypothetical protein